MFLPMPRRTRAWSTEWKWKVHLESKRNGLLIWKELSLTFPINHDRGTWLHWLRTIKVKGLIRNKSGDREGSGRDTLWSSE